jgi:hypothetical protein
MPEAELFLMFTQRLNTPIAACGLQEVWRQVRERSD